MTKLYLFTQRKCVSVVHFSAAVVFLSILFASCAISKPTYIFKDIVRDTVIHGFTDTDVELKIQKNDILNISISSLSPAEDQLFNSAMGTGGGSLSTKSSGTSAGYVVSLDGNIYIHKLGTLPVNGLTRKELKLQLEKQLLPYLKDPIVNVSFANHSVTVMGAVGTSQILNMPAEKIALIDAIALSGNVSENGTVKNVLVIRETPTSKEFKHLNLESPSIFTSPWYYLQPKDIVVINPNEDKIYKEASRTRNQQILTTAISTISIVLIILDRIF